MKYQSFFFFLALNTYKNIAELTDWKNLYQVSSIHGVQYIIFLKLKQLYEAGQLDIPKEFYEKWNAEFYYNTMKNVQRNAFIHKMLKKLEENGISCCLLKGEVLAALYPCPEARISGDTDIFIGPENIEKASALLRGMGFEVKPKNHTSHHVVCTHPIGGMVELHLYLHDELFEDVWFDKQSVFTEPFRKITLDGDEINTLGYTDGAIFVTLHLIKHFLSQGVGIRQVLDTLLYLKTYRQELDWESFNHLMKHLKYEKFMDVLYTIGIQHLGFREEDFPPFVRREAQAEQVLDEIMEAGAFGFSDIQRKNFYITYTEERFQRFKKEDYESYMKAWKHESIWKAVFLDRKRMEQKYPYVKKTAILLPIAWLQRIFYLIASVLFGKKRVKEYTHAVNKNEQSDFVQKKMSLIRELDMI